MSVRDPMTSLCRVVDSLSAVPEDDRRRKRLDEYVAAHSGAADPAYVHVREMDRVIDSDSSFKPATKAALKKRTAAAAKKEADDVQAAAGKAPTADEILGDIAVEASQPAMLGALVRAWAALLFFVAGVGVFVVSSVARKGDPDTTSLLVAAGFGLLSFLLVMGYGTVKLSRK